MEDKDGPDSIDIPLLISKKAMSKAEVKIDLANGLITLRGAEVRAVAISAGNLCVYLLQSESASEVANTEEEEQERVKHI